MGLMNLEFHPVSNFFGMFVFKEVLNVFFFSEFPLVSVVMASFSTLIFILVFCFHFVSLADGLSIILSAQRGNFLFH